MEPSAYYDRPFVVELRKLFGDPQPPERVTERQFDGFQDVLEALSRTPWHEIRPDDWTYYFSDLAGVPLQQELFDYLFPAALIAWRDSLFTRDYLGGGIDLYGGLLHGEVLCQRMSSERREQVLDWMATAFLDAVDSLLPLEIVARAKRNANLHFFLETFNALGASVHVLHVLLPRLIERQSPGALRFWLTLGAGIAWRENEVPWILPRNNVDGGGGIYLLENASPHLENGFIPENLQSFKDQFNLDVLLKIFSDSSSLAITNEEGGMVAQCTVQIWDNREWVQSKLDWYFNGLAKIESGLKPEPD